LPASSSVNDAALLAVSAHLNGLLGNQGAELLQAALESEANIQSSLIAAVESDDNCPRPAPTSLVNLIRMQALSEVCKF
jgi:hypothetical protein